MKILLISSNIAQMPYPVYPLGLSTIASGLRKAGHQVYQFDFLVGDKSLDVLSGEIKNIQPDIIGISVRNIDNTNLLNEQRYIDVVKNIVIRIRQKSSAKIVLGGSGFSLMPQEIMNEVGADYGIIGEGEKLMLEFVQNASRSLYPQEKLIKSTERLMGEEISAADYDPKILDFYLKRGNVASVQTKRGCSEKCIYCSYPILEGAIIRYRKPTDVVDDVEKLVNSYKAKNIFFTDSVFNDRKGRYLEVVAEIRRRKLDVSWTAFFTPYGLDEKNVALMKEGGLKAAELGSDASNDTALRKLGKNFLFRDIIKCNDLLVKYGIATAHYFMFGCPGETPELVLEGVENIKSLKKSVSFIFMGIRILPGTPLAALSEKEGIISAHQNLLKPVYYISPNLDENWLKGTLTKAFSGVRNCILPSDKLENRLALLHKLGYPEPLWSMLIRDDEPPKRRKQRVVE